MPGFLIKLSEGSGTGSLTVGEQSCAVLWSAAGVEKGAPPGVRGGGHRPPLTLESVSTRHCPSPSSALWEEGCSV